MDIRKKPSTMGTQHNRNGSWLSGHAKRQSRHEVATAAPAAAGSAAAGTAGFVVPPLPSMSEHPGQVEAGPRLAHNESVSGSGVIAAGNPDTPPPLRGAQRWTSLLHREQPAEARAEKKIEPELMIGEIRVNRV